MKALKELQNNKIQSERANSKLAQKAKVQKITNNSKFQGRKITHKMSITESKQEVFCLGYEQGDEKMAVGYGDGVVRIFDPNSGALTTSLQKMSQFDEVPVTALRWRPVTNQSKTANILVTAYADGTLKHWHATSAKCINMIQEEKNQIYSIDYNLFGNLLATAGKDQHVRIYDEQTKKLTATIKDNGEELTGQGNRIYSVKWSPYDQNLFVSGGWDSTLQVYDLREKAPVAAIQGPLICGADSIDFRSDGNSVITGSYRQENALEVYDIRMHKKVRTFNWDGPQAKTQEVEVTKFGNTIEMREVSGDLQPFLYCCKFNQQQDIIYTGGAGNNEFRAFDWETGNIVGMINNLPTSILCMDLATSSNRFAFGCADASVRIFNMKHPKKQEAKENQENL